MFFFFFFFFYVGNVLVRIMVHVFRVGKIIYGFILVVFLIVSYFLHLCTY